MYHSKLIISTYILGFRALITEAIPTQDKSIIDTNLLGSPFINAVLPLEQGSTPWPGLFRRQGCPNNSLLCPSGTCCSYDTSCCGNSCCPQGFFCTGGTAAAPCCVPITSVTNTCESANGNLCERPGDVVCNGINICCPPNNYCYYDTNNNPRCSPAVPSPIDTPTPTPTPIIDPVTPTPAVDTPTPTPVIDNPAPTPVDYTPVPTPTPNHSSSSSFSSSSSSSSRSFWTPATIGGIAGGASGGLILLALLIFCCCRKRRTLEPVEGPISPLSDSAIYWKIASLETTSDWQEAYIQEARRMSHGVHIDHASWMRDFAIRCVRLRIQQLRAGGERDTAMLKAGAIGAIPIFGRIWNKLRGTTKKFTKMAVGAVGMGDTEDASELYRQAKAVNKSTLLQKMLHGMRSLGKHAFKEWWADSDLAAHLQDEMTQYLADELGAEAAESVLTEAVHLKPGLGQVIAGTTAAYRCSQQMGKLLDWLEGVALEFHLRVFAINAISEVFPQDFEEGIENEKKGLTVNKRRL